MTYLLVLGLFVVATFPALFLIRPYCEACVANRCPSCQRCARGLTGSMDLHAHRIMRVGRW